MSLNYFNPFFTVKVMDALFIANQTASKDQEFLMNNKFALIVNTCPRQFKILPIPGIYKVTNFHWQNSKGQLIESINISSFQAIFDEITKNIAEGYGTLIVSDRGHSRAITFVLLYLIERFKWDLFKSLEYLNSKKQNLEVRATFLKLIVNYEKSLKSKTSNSDVQKESQDDLPMSIRQENKKQKWSQANFKSVQEQIISNTFKNSCKKRNLNEINQEFRQKIGRLTNQERRAQMNQRICSSDLKNEDKKKGKAVQFSNQIQIIINESPMTHIFPQYEELSSEMKIGDHHEVQIKGQINHNRETKGYQEHTHVNTGIKYDTKPLLMNNKIINVKKMDQMHGKSSNKPEFEDLDSFEQEMDENEFFSRQQFKSKRNQNITQPLKRQLNSPVKKRQKAYFVKEPENKVKAESKNQEKVETKNQKQKLIQIRPSSLKKLKMALFDQKMKNTSSPKKKQKKQKRLLTDPQYEYEFENPKLQEENLDLINKRKLSNPKHQSSGNGQKQSFHQHKKSASAVMANSLLSRFQKCGFMASNLQKRCPTPQITSQININSASTSANQSNFVSRPLSRGKSNSLKMTNKKSVTSSVKDQKTQKKNNILNVNINVNIGKLQLFASQNTQELLTKGLISKQKITKTIAQFDKFNFVQSRLRSNSSSSNYSKISASSLSMKNQKQQSSISQKVQQNILKNKSSQGAYTVGEIQTEQKISRLHEHLIDIDDQDNNIEESFSKKGILERVNRKLMKNSRNSKRQEQRKNSNILENNFV